MRTTLDIDEDVLAAAKDIARRERVSAGTVVSRLLRKALTDSGLAVRESADKYGFSPFPTRGGVVTNADIDRLREEAGD